VLTNVARVGAACAAILLAWSPRPSAQQTAARSDLTALDRYVAAPDSHFAFRRLGELARVNDVAVSIVELTSQQWLTPAEVDRTLWRHWLIVYRPAKVARDVALLYISGGDNDGKRPSKVNRVLANLAGETATITAELRMVPNQPLTFSGDPSHAPRTEDEIIAYTWEKYLKTGDDTWPLRLPMTKASVRAMDTITAFAASTEGGKAKATVSKFMVSGGSKRGWTTWTTAAVDDRVIAIVPYVIDCLNNEPSMNHHYRAYGFWAPAIGDYWKIHNWAGTPQYKALMEIEDPYSYRDRLTMPKLIVNSTGDQYFLPDSWQFYYDDLPGEKYLRYVPNTKHDLNGSDARETLDAFYESIQKGTPRPRFTWKMEKDGSITVNTKDKPTEVRLWHATNAKARDFRLDIIGKAYTSELLQPVKEGTYVGRMAKPDAGFTAYFVEMTFPSGGKYPFKFTTGVRVTPDVLPFPAPPKQNPDASSAAK